MKHRLETLLLIASVGLGCQLKVDPEETLQQLGDRVRVLGLRSLPADVAPGESAQLSALVYIPGVEVGMQDGCDAAEPTRYAWSWCPLRDDGGLDCAIDEDTAREVWSSHGDDEVFPSYTLQTEPVATVRHGLSPEFAQALCSAYAETVPGSKDLARSACRQDIGISVQLVVTRCGQDEVAIRNIPLVEPATEPALRNENPVADGTVSFRTIDGASRLAADEALILGENYIVRSEFETPLECQTDQADEDCQAQLFVPDPSESARRERIQTTWFLTHGSPFLEEVTQGAGGLSGSVNGSALEDPSESYVVLENEDRPGEARVYMVVRDERGGIGWTSHPYRVEDGSVTAAMGDPE